jgi:lipopolysaccharide export system permease protein
MKILDRYVLVSFLKNYLISFMVLVGMYVVLDMVFNFDELANLKTKSADSGFESVLSSIGGIADFYAHQTFLFFVHLSGIIPVVAAAFTLMRLSRFNELTAVLAAGVPLLRVAMPIIIAGVIVNGLMIADQEIVIPRIMHKLTRDHDELTRSDAKTFDIRGMQDSDGALLYSGRFTPPAQGRPATMEVVDIIQRAEVERPTRDAQGNPTTRKVREVAAHISADKAVWDPAAEAWVLTNGLRVTNLGETEEPSRTEPVEVYKSNVTPEEVALYHSGKWVELLSTSRIDELIARPGSYGQASLMRVKHARFTMPVMNVILLLLAIPCVLTREPGTLKTAATKCLILTGLGMGSIFLSQQLAGQPPSDPQWQQLWPVLMAWVPIFIFFPIAVILLERVKT